jgi:hypothetical protein
MRYMRLSDLIQRRPPLERLAARLGLEREDGAGVPEAWEGLRARWLSHSLY